MGYSLGLDGIDDGRAVAPLDFDGDGDLDLALLNLRGLRLLENTATPRRFVRVRLMPPASALGAIVEIETAEGVQRDYVKATTGFSTQVPLELHFGLKDAERIERLTVRWPGGEPQTFEGLPVDRGLTIREGQGGVEERPLPRWPERSRPRGISGFPAGLEAERVEGGRERVIAGEGPAIVHFWAPGKEDQLSMLASLSQGVQVVGICVEGEDRDRIRERIASLGLKYRQYVGEKIFGAAGGRMPLPTTMVIDGEGRLLRAFYRTVLREELEAVLNSLGRGDWESDYEFLGGLHLFREELEEATRHFERAIEINPNAVKSHFYLGVIRAKQKRHAEAFSSFRRHLKLNPEHASGYRELGVVFFKMGRTREAIGALRMAIRLDSGSWESHNALGAVYWKSGSIGEATKVFQQALKLNPKNEIARRFLQTVPRPKR